MFGHVLPRFARAVLGAGIRPLRCLLVYLHPRILAVDPLRCLLVYLHPRILAGDPLRCLLGYVHLCILAGVPYVVCWSTLVETSAATIFSTLK